MKIYYERPPPFFKKRGGFSVFYTYLFKVTMRTSNKKMRIAQLKFQIELEQSNLKYAVELEKDYDTLYRMRESIRILRADLKELESTRPNKRAAS